MATRTPSGTIIPYGEDTTDHIRGFSEKYCRWSRICVWTPTGDEMGGAILCKTGCWDASYEGLYIAEDVVFCFHCGGRIAINKTGGG